jgi:hypothetical protein
MLVQVDSSLFGDDLECANIRGDTDIMFHLHAEVDKAVHRREAAV